MAVWICFATKTLWLPPRRTQVHELPDCFSAQTHDDCNLTRTTRAVEPSRELSDCVLAQTHADSNWTHVTRAVEPSRGGLGIVTILAWSFSAGVHCLPCAKAVAHITGAVGLSREGLGTVEKRRIVFLHSIRSGLIFWVPGTLVFLCFFY